MPLGHIKLGPTQQELKSYILVDPNMRTRSRINPLAPKIQEGGSQFMDYTNHDYWEMVAWGKGIGYHTSAGVEGGYYYGEVDTRASNNFILPPLLTAINEEKSTDLHPSINNIKDGQQYVISPPDKVAVQFLMDNAGPVYIYIDSNGVVNASIHSDNAGEPGTELWSGLAENNPSLVTPEWARIATDITPTPGAIYWLVLWDDTSTITVHGMVESSISGDILLNDGSWSPLLSTGNQPLYSPYIAGRGVLGTTVAAQTVGDDLYILNSNGDIFHYELGGFTLFASTGQTSFDMELWQGSLIVSHEDNAVMSSVNATTGVVTPLGVNGDLLIIWNGYLWKSLDNVVSYSNDTSTWTDITVGPNDYVVNGMAGLGDDILVSTDQALWRIAPGDFVFGVTKWAYQTPNNGVGMINNQGVAFIPVNNMLIRSQSGAPFINIWKRDESLPSGRAGIINQVLGTNKEVIVSVDPAEADGVSTAWSFNNQGWHHVAKLPMGQCICHMHYDNSTDSIWLFSDSGYGWRFYASSTASNPLTDYLTTFMPSGFVDMGFFHGGLQTLIKDFDSVQAIGQDISPTKPVRIFWRMDDGGSEEAIFQNDGNPLIQNDGETLYQTILGWHILGDIVQSGNTLRWDDYTVRPVGTTIRLAYAIFSDDVNTSPSIDAIVVKYHAHIRDQFRWQLPIMVHDWHEDTDEGRDSRTYNDQITALEALEVNRYLPVWFEDVDGRVYEVKVIGFADRLMKFERKLDGVPLLQTVVDMTIEEMSYAEA